MPRSPLGRCVGKRRISILVVSGCEASTKCGMNHTTPARRQTVCKPGSVPPESGDGHSSGTFVTERLARPTRAAARKARPAAPASADAACRSYLVLLPVGFALPPPLPAARCALTAPFHPCRPPARKVRTGRARRYIFCGTFPGVAPAGRYPAPYLRGARTFLPPPSAASAGGERPSDRLAWDDVGCRARAVKQPREAKCFRLPEELGAEQDTGSDADHHGEAKRHIAPKPVKLRLHPGFEIFDPGF
jgi:hypothetical protein